jgi:hypothetical protein
MAEFERSIIRERTKAGLDAARARGRTGGRPPALSAKDIAAAKAMLADPEITVREVARRLKVSTRSAPPPDECNLSANEAASTVRPVDLHPSGTPVYSGLRL